MAPVSLIPVTLRSVKHMMLTLGYELVEDDGRVLIWKRNGKSPKGLEKIFKSWPTVVSKQYPAFEAEGHDLPVYDRSDTTDLIVEITGTGRTNGARIVAILRSEADAPDIPPAHVINLLCAVCGKPSKVDRWNANLTGMNLKCPHCGHEEARSSDRPDKTI